MNDKPELLSPAGSFSSALYAFKAGADAVYLGLKSFSARTSARNFTFDELRRLKNYAADREKKIYVALNTIITGDDYPALHGILNKLSILEINGIIIQDLGVLSLLKKEFPEIPVHASTQMAVHTTEGISFLKEKGIERIILARELSLAEIRELHKYHPETELEVFIHGALCYSFSGLCLASGILLGRSANRGECAQVCRTWFKGKTGSGYYFSMKDLAAFRELKALQKAGVSSFKIEGRMKSPEYTGLTVQVYRKLLDGEINPDDWEEYARDARTVFSRTYNDFWLQGKPRSPVVDPSYPSHRGIKAGTVRGKGKDFFTLQTVTELSVRDGLLFFIGGEPPVPVNFGIKRMETATGKHITSSPSGTTIRIYTSQLPDPGITVFKTSSHNIHWPEIKTAAYPFWKKEIDLSITLTEKEITVSAETTVGILDCTNAVTLDHARKPRDFKMLLEKIFKESDTSWFICRTISFINKTDRERKRIFIPPSQLKRLKNSFYLKADALLKETCSTVGTGRELTQQPDKGILRKDLVPKTHTPIPFVLFHKDFPLSDLKKIGNKWYLPLMPVTFNSKTYFEKLKQFLTRHSREHFVLGLNNSGHLQWAKELSRDSRISFFIDYGLYVASIHTYMFLLKEIPHIEFMYYWIEGTEKNHSSLLKEISRQKEDGPPLYFIGKDFSPHLFMSRGCYTNTINGGTCPSGCRRSFSYNLSQQEKTFTVKVEDCFTWLFQRRT